MAQCPGKATAGFLGGIWCTNIFLAFSWGLISCIILSAMKTHSLWLITLGKATVRFLFNTLYSIFQLFQYDLKSPATLTLSIVPLWLFTFENLLQNVFMGYIIDVPKYESLILLSLV